MFVYGKHIQPSIMKHSSFLGPFVSYVENEVLWIRFQILTIGLHHPLDGITNPEYKLLHFKQLILFFKEKKALAFNWDRYCHLALCLQLILFHWLKMFANVYTNCKLYYKKFYSTARKFWKGLEILNQNFKKWN